jgi:lipopolysaccharide biosynthesis glycosyltransferase
MKVAFTLCSINYLAQALTLGQSLKRTNPQYHFSIGLVDRLDGVSFPEELQSLLKDFELVEVHTIGIPDFDQLVAKYDITELNTAAKPFYIDYYFKKYADVEQVIYFDPDIIVYKTLEELDNHLLENNLVVTPHTMTPINDDCNVSEQQINNGGLYNLGFIAVKKSDESVRFVNWWKDRLAKYCYIKFSEGLFTDQIWVNFAPLFFEKVRIERDFGYNMAYWNLHERTLTNYNGQYFVNHTIPLKFFHFSGYQLGNPASISRYQNRFTFEQRPDIVPLFKEYVDCMNANKHGVFKTYKCYYVALKGVNLQEKFKGLKKFIAKGVIRKLEQFT